MSQTPACGAPQILEQRVLQIVRIADQKREYAHSTKHDGWQNDQKNAGHAAGWELPTLFLSHFALTLDWVIPSVLAVISADDGPPR